MNLSTFPWNTETVNELQEFCVTNNIAVPKYEEEIGDDKKYEVTCKVSEAISAQAWDLNKKHARILAAKKGKLVKNIM